MSSIKNVSKNYKGRDPLYEVIVFSRCNMKIFFGRFFFIFHFFCWIFLSSELILFHHFKLRKSYVSQNQIFDRKRGVQAVKVLNLGSHMVRSKFKCLGIGVVAFLSLVKMPYQIIDQKNIQIFANQMKQKPIAQFLSI